MIFVRYRGPSAAGVFTRGKTYVCSPGLDAEADAVDFGHLAVVDDEGVKITFEDRGRFDFLSTVRAVYLAGGSAGPGVVLDDVADGFFRMSFRGREAYMRASNFIILDETTLEPGSWAMDQETGLWLRITRVDECERVLLEGMDEMMVPEDLCFAIRDGRVAEPVVTCLDDSFVDGEGKLTEGMKYFVQRSSDGLVEIVADDGEVGTYLSERFEENLDLGAVLGRLVADK